MEQNKKEKSNKFYERLDRENMMYMRTKEQLELKEKRTALEDVENKERDNDKKMNSIQEKEKNEKAEEKIAKCFPLTEQSIAARKLEEKLKDEQERKIVEESFLRRMEQMAKLEETIVCNMEKQKLHNEERQKIKELNRQRIAQCLETEFNIDLKSLPRGGELLINKFETIEKKKEEQKRLQKKKKTEILKRIFKEEEIKEKAKDVSLNQSLHLDKKQKISSVQKQNKETKVTNDLIDIFTREMDLKSQSEDTDDQIKEEKEKKKGRKKKKKEVTITTKEVEEKEEEEKEDEKNDNKSKSMISDDQKKAEELLVKMVSTKEEPKRQKIEAADVIKDFENVSHLCEHLALVEETIKMPLVLYGEEKGLVATPSKIILKDLLPGQVYSNEITVTNTTGRKVKCLVHRINMPDDVDTQVLQVEKLDYQVLWAGSSFTFKLVMNLAEDSTLLEFEADIIIQAVREDMTREFHIPIHCIPAQPEPLVCPTTVNFLVVPEYEKDKQHAVLHKYINVHNHGAVSTICKIVEQSHLSLHEETDVETSPHTETMEGLEEEEEDVDHHHDIPHEVLAAGHAPGDSLMKVVRQKQYTQVLKKKAKQHKKEKKVVRRETGRKERINMEVFCKEIVDEIFLYATQIFKIFPKYYIELGPKSSMQVEVRFDPDSYNSYSEEFIFMFEDLRGQSCGKFTVTLNAETVDVPMSVHPPVITFGTCFLDSGVYQDSYSLSNNGKTSTQVVQKVPQALKEFVFVSPKETYIQPGETLKLSVQLIPSQKYEDNASEFYDKATHLLQFPIHIHLLSSAYSGCQSLVVDVFAKLTSPYNMVLTPSTINFGTVTTLETVIANVNLKNDTESIQEYGFVSLPKGVAVQPGFGFGVIHPDQTIPLYITLSPRFSNLTGVSEVDMKFEVKCVNVASLGGQDYSNKMYHDITKCKMSSKRTELKNVESEFISIDNKTSLTEETKQPTVDKSLQNVIKCEARIVHPMCYLEPSHIVLPPTPCESYTVVPLFLKLNTPIQKKLCAKKEGIQKYSVWFEFKSSTKGLMVYPQSGTALLEKPIKLSLVFQPKLDTREIETKAKEMKHKEEKHKKEDYHKPRTKKSSKLLVDPKESSLFLMKENEANDITIEELHPKDYIAAENELLKKYVTKQFNAKITCKTETVPSDSGADQERHKATLYLDVKCSAVRPDIILRYTSHHIDFRFVAIGTSLREHIEIQSINDDSVMVRLGVLNPIGPFTSSLFVPIKIELWEILRITFSFTPDVPGVMIKEFTEICAGKTTIPIMLCGEGVLPKYEFVPDFPIHIVETRQGKKSDYLIQIKNNCAAKLTFKINRIAVYEGISATTKDKPKQKKEKGKKLKRVKKQVSKLSLGSGEDEIKEFEEEFKQAEKGLNEIFAIGGSTESLNEIICTPFEKGIIKISFNPPVTTKSVTKVKDLDMTHAMKYAVKYLLILGRIEVCEIIVIGIVK